MKSNRRRKGTSPTPARTGNSKLLKQAACQWKDWIRSWGRIEIEIEIEIEIGIGIGIGIGIPSIPSDPYPNPLCASAPTADLRPRLQWRGSMNAAA